jgi:hypothetical protein
MMYVRLLLHCSVLSNVIAKGFIGAGSLFILLAHRCNRKAEILLKGDV